MKAGTALTARADARGACGPPVWAVPRAPPRHAPRPPENGLPRARTHGHGPRNAIRERRGLGPGGGDRASWLCALVDRVSYAARVMFWILRLSGPLLGPLLGRGRGGEFKYTLSVRIAS